MQLYTTAHHVFGFSVGDFIAATQVTLNAVAQLRAFTSSTRDEPTQGAIIVLSFRVLQAQRIDEMQAELRGISLEKVGRSSEQTAEQTAEQTVEEGQALNTKIDECLHRYG